MKWNENIKYTLDFLKKYEESEIILYDTNKTIEDEENIVLLTCFQVH